MLSVNKGESSIFAWAASPNKRAANENRMRFMIGKYSKIPVGNTIFALLTNTFP